MTSYKVSTLEVVISPHEIIVSSTLRLDCFLNKKFFSKAWNIKSIETLVLFTKVIIFLNFSYL